MSTIDHEVVQLFASHVHPLSPKLVEMLNENYIHQTERRGCGYTQSSRFLAEYINQARHPIEYEDLKIFQDFDNKGLKKIVDQLGLDDWHNLDQNPKIIEFLATQSRDEFAELVRHHVHIQQQLRTLQQHAHLEESQLVCQMIADVILPKQSSDILLQLNALAEKPKVGSCPMAEKFFLKVAHNSILRQGKINIFVDDQQQPLLLEKLNMGDDHSCISLQPILLNGVRIPAGSLFSVDYDLDGIENKTQNQKFKGYVIPYQAIQGFWFLRLTTLAISPQNRKRAFTTHFQQQVINGLYSPETTQLSQLVDVAQAQIG